MFQTHVGATAEDDPSSLVYLRPETAQGIFINFANVLDRPAGANFPSAWRRSANRFATK